MLHPTSIYIGSDHAGFELKNDLVHWLNKAGYHVFDLGTNTPESVDYPDFAHLVAEKVVADSAMGIIICGSGIGVSIAANKHQGVRAALCWSPETAILARQHNNANILCLPARFVTTKQAEIMTYDFLNTLFEGGRHQDRVNKIEL